MKPKPFVALNHFTLPVAIRVSLLILSLGVSTSGGPYTRRAVFVATMIAVEDVTN
jgi:hypothetical protein